MAGNTEGLDPNDSNVHLVYIPSAVFVVICPILTALRVWARLRRGGKMGADDYVAIVALVRPALDNLGRETISNLS